MKKKEKQKKRTTVRKKRSEPPRLARIEADDAEQEPFAEEVQEPPPPRVPVVGIGASAGGLEAFSQLLDALGEEPGVALVFVQHLAPQHESALPTLLGGRTSLPVIQVREGTRVELNR